MPDTIKVKDTIPPNLPDQVSDSVQTQQSVWENFAFFNDTTETNTADTASIKEAPEVKNKSSNQKKSNQKKEVTPIAFQQKKNTDDVPIQKNYYPNQFFNSFQIASNYCFDTRSNTLLNAQNDHSYILNPNQIKPIKLPFRAENYWIMGFFLLIVFGLIWLRLFNVKLLELYFRSITNFQLGNKLHREHNTVVNKISSVLNGIFIVSITVFIYQRLKPFLLDTFALTPFTSFLLILAGFSSIILVRFGILKLIGWIFNSRRITDEYLFHLLLIYKVTGIVLIPFIILSYYLPFENAGFMNIIGIIIIAIIALLRVQRGLKIILRSNVFLFYIVLYLCTLEIIPILVFIKFVTTTIISSS